MKIVANEEVIKAILFTINNTIAGVGINDLYSFDYQISPFESSITFVRKDGKMVDPNDMFWLGFYCKEHLP